MAINLNGADHSQFNRDEKNTNVSRSPFSGTYTTAFTMNEGEIVPCYREVLIPNSNLQKKETYVLYQSPLATRNFSNQRVYTHTFSMPVKHMWHEWREVQFGGRYQDNSTPILHFLSSGFADSSLSTCLFHASLLCDYIPRGSLLDHIGGVQTDVHLSDSLTPNPWLCFLYLTVYKYFFLNQPLLRGDKKWRRIWFPSNEEKWSFETGSFNVSSGAVCRFWSPEHRSGCSFDYFSLTLSSDGSSLSSKFSCRDRATGLYCTSLGVFSSSTPSEVGTVTVTLPYPHTVDGVRVLSDSDFIRLNWSTVTKAFLDYLSNLDNPVCLLDLFETRFRNFRNDYYMSGLPSPLMVPESTGQGATGQAGKPNIHVDNITSSVDVSDLYPLDTVQNVVAIVRSGQSPEEWDTHPLYTYATGAPYGTLMFGSGSTAPSGYDSAYLRGTVPVSSLKDSLARLKINTSIGLSIDMDQLRLLSATTMYLEALTRSDGDYASNVRAIYGVTPLELDLKPRYLGGTVSNVYSMDVVQTAPQGSGQDTILGSVTQRGQAGHSGGQCRHFTKDTEVVLTLMSIIPDSVYCQGIDRKLIARSPLDIPNPMFMGLGMDAVLNYELYVSGSDSTDLSPLSYQGAWDFYRFRRNEVHDLMIPTFLNGELQNKPFTQMNQIRYFNSTPSLSEDLVTTKGNISHEHLAVTDVAQTPEYSVIVSNQASLVYPLTKYAKGQGL